MVRDDKSLYLLFIEPKKEERLEHPVDDILTEAMEMAYEDAIEGTSSYSNPSCNGRFSFDGGWMGFHMTDCGQMSGSRDLLLRSGHITNSLCVFYLRWYRNSIKDNDMLKILEVVKEYERDLPYDFWHLMYYVRDRKYKILGKEYTEEQKRMRKKSLKRDSFFGGQKIFNV